jgi:hypothetical protein
MCLALYFSKILIIWTPFRNIVPNRSLPHPGCHGEQVNGLVHWLPESLPLPSPIREHQGGPESRLQSKLLNLNRKSCQAVANAFHCRSPCSIHYTESYLGRSRMPWIPAAGPCYHPEAWKSSQPGSLYGTHRSTATQAGIGAQTAGHLRGTALHRACWGHGVRPPAWAAPSNSSSCVLSWNDGQRKLWQAHPGRCTLKPSPSRSLSRVLWLIELRLPQHKWEGYFLQHHHSIQTCFFLSLTHVSMKFWPFFIKFYSHCCGKIHT